MLSAGEVLGRGVRPVAQRIEGAWTRTRHDLGRGVEFGGSCPLRGARTNVYGVVTA